jgi:hypothetical protein
VAPLDPEGPTGPVPPVAPVEPVGPSLPVRLATKTHVLVVVLQVNTYPGMSSKLQKYNHPAYIALQGSSCG